MRAQFRGLLGGGVLLSLSSALVVVLATIVLIPTERGVMVVAATIPGVVSLVATLGIGPALRQQRPRAAAHTPALNSAYACLTIGTVALGFLGTAATYALVAQWIPSLRDRPALMLAASTLGAVLVATAQLTEAWYSAGAFTTGSVWAGSVAVGGFILVLIGGQDSATQFLVSQSAGSAVVLLAQLRHLVRARLIGRPRIELHVVRGLLRRGVPTLGFTAGAALVLRLDRVVLGVVASPDVVAVYALAATVSEVARLAPVALGQMALHAAAKGSGPGELTRLARLGALSVLAAAVVLVPSSYFLLPRVFGPAYDDASALVAILLLAEVFFSAYLITNLALLGQGRQRHAGAIGLTGALVCVPAYLTGAGAAGAAGCGLASVVVYAVLMAMSRRQLVRAAVNA